MESKLLRNGWAEESTPSAPLMPINLTPSKPTADTRRRHVGGEGASGGDGGGGSGGGGMEPPRPTTSALLPPLSVDRWKSRVPSWLATWWEEFTSNKAVMVEVISRAVFPLLFLIFNAVYWPWYLM